MKTKPWKETRILLCLVFLQLSNPFFRLQHHWRLLETFLLDSKQSIQMKKTINSNKRSLSDVDFYLNFLVQLQFSFITTEVLNFLLLWYRCVVCFSYVVIVSVMYQFFLSNFEVPDFFECLCHWIFYSLAFSVFQILKPNSFVHWPHWIAITL